MKQISSLVALVFCHCGLVNALPTELRMKQTSSHVARVFCHCGVVNALPTELCSSKPQAMLPCADGGCRHIAAALFDLLSTVINAEMQACTSKVCTWVRKGKRIEGCLPVIKLDVGRPEYGKKMKSTPSLSNFQPMTASYDIMGLRMQFKRKLVDVCRDAVVVPFLPNLPQKITSEAATFLEEDDEGNLTLKSETKWNYQIHGLMGISGIHNAELVIYTNKGTLIIAVSFDEGLWNVIKSKLRLFYVNYMVEELLTKKIYKSLSK
ncbi:hypothetical protein OS493_036684 [Desmophyllum pertusum]|uniref:Uncharacterized protein n=1 Tax=Desmophyllum pertusum TaxID=174260 RepID=A0A9W9ZVI0_9CNID|nr:hypothetical protein OS493_036684 [Desmophyllum pertusum]